MGNRRKEELIQRERETDKQTDRQTEIVRNEEVTTERGRKVDLRNNEKGRG